MKYIVSLFGENAIDESILSRAIWIRFYIFKLLKQEE